jgi:hypothetical protein
MEIKRINRIYIQRRAGVFFQSQKWKNLLVFLVFVALAFCFWILQSFQQKVEREIYIPVRYFNIPKEVAINDTLPDKFTLKLADKGTVFLKYLMDSEYASLTIDLKNLPLDKTSYTFDRLLLSSYIQDFLLNTTQLISFKPEVLRINYSPLKKKEVPVTVAGKIAAATGYIFTESLSINPSKIWIYGDEETLDTIRFITTETVKEVNVQKKLDLTLKLNAPKGVRLSTEKIELSGNVEEYTEKKFELPVTCYNSPKNIHVRFFPSTVEVVCRIALSKYAEANAIDLDAGINYQELSHNRGVNIPLALNRKPQWLINYRIIPDKVEYLIEQKKDL